MDLTSVPLVESRKRTWEEAKNAQSNIPPPKRPLSNFYVEPWSGILGSYQQDLEFSKFENLQRFALQRGDYGRNPFVPINEEENPVTRTVLLNSFWPRGQSTIHGDGRLAFKFRGVGVLSRVSRDHPYDTGERLQDGYVFVNRFSMKEKEHVFREERVKNLTQDYQESDINLLPYGGLVTCITFAELKEHMAAYTTKVKELRQTVVATNAEAFALSDHQKKIYGWSRPTTVNGGSQAAPGVEALLALCTGPRDLYDLFRPMGIFFTGKNKIDADRDLVTILSGGRAKMRISSLDNTICREGECAPFSLWLAYQQKYTDVVESANRHLDNYPDVDLVITNKPQQKFMETFMNNTGNASYSTRSDPTKVTPFIFLQVAIVNLSSYPALNDETDVHVTLAEHDRPFVVFPSRVKTV